MYLLDWSPVTSNSLGYAIVLLVSFALNRTFTFRSTGKHLSELLRFMIVFAVAFGANLITLCTLTDFFSLHKAFSQIVAGILYVAVSYLLNKYFVFRSDNINQGAGVC
jgi:putative flippase GtrA